MSTVSVLVPLAITDAMLSSASGFTEPDSTYDGTAWSAATVYKAGDVAVRGVSGVHRVYTCYKDMAAARSAAPEADTNYWYDTRPTNKWAAFDGTTNTVSKGTTSIDWVLVPGFFNAVCFYGLLGATLTVQIKDAPGGTIVFGPTVYNIQETPFDEYDYCWGQINQLDKLVVSGLTPYPSAELTITIAGTGTVGAGIIAIGDLASFVPSDYTWAGPNYGATSKPTTYSDINVLQDGTVKVTSRRSATDLSMDLQVPKGQGDTALRVMQRVLDQPAAWIGTDATGYDGLNSFGIGSGQVVYEDARELVHIDVRGLA